MGQGGILRWFHEASGKIMEPLKAIVSFRPRSCPMVNLTLSILAIILITLVYSLIYGRESVRVDCNPFTIRVKECFDPCQA